MEVQIRGVSLDLGKTLTGLAYWHDRELAWTEEASFKHTETLGQTLAEFGTWLGLWIKPGVDWIAYEQRMTGGQRLGNRHLEIHYGMVGMLHVRAWNMRVPILSIPIGTAKKALTGNGKAEKDAMVAAAKERYGRHITSHDMADAIAVGIAALDRMQFPT
jgi:hypothetical protein